MIYHWLRLKTTAFRVEDGLQLASLKYDFSIDGPIKNSLELLDSHFVYDGKRENIFNSNFSSVRFTNARNNSLF